MQEREEQDLPENQQPEQTPEAEQPRAVESTPLAANAPETVPTPAVESTPQADDTPETEHTPDASQQPDGADTTAPSQQPETPPRYGVDARSDSRPRYERGQQSGGGYQSDPRQRDTSYQRPEGPPRFDPYRRPEPTPYPESEEAEGQSSREVRPESEHSEQGPARLPFNDRKHPPTRPEIDILLGVSPSAELRRFEHQLELMESMINWAMQWYENDTGWGFRASFHARVLCVLHFYRGFFTVTLSIPEIDVEKYQALSELTPGLRKAFEYFTPSTKMKWITFHVRTDKEVRAVLAMLKLKLADLKKKTKRS